MTEELEHKYEVEVKQREGRQKLPDDVKEELKIFSQDLYKI